MGMHCGHLGLRAQLGHGVRSSEDCAQGKEGHSQPPRAGTASGPGH